MRLSHCLRNFQKGKHSLERHFPWNQWKSRNLVANVYGKLRNLQVILNLTIFPHAYSNVRPTFRTKTAHPLFTSSPIVRRTLLQRGEEEREQEIKKDRRTDRVVDRSRTGLITGNTYGV